MILLLCSRWVGLDSWLVASCYTGCFPHRYSVDRVVTNLRILCFCEWYVVETRSCSISPKGASVVAVCVLVSAGLTPALSQVLVLILLWGPGLQGACPEPANSEFIRTLWGSLVLLSLSPMVGAARVALSCVLTCFSSSRGPRPGLALQSLEGDFLSPAFSPSPVCALTRWFSRCHLWQGWSVGTAQAHETWKLWSLTRSIFSCPGFQVCTFHWLLPTHSLDPFLELFWQKQTGR